MNWYGAVLMRAEGGLAGGDAAQGRHRGNRSDVARDAAHGGRALRIPDLLDAVVDQPAGVQPGRLSTRARSCD